MPSREDSRSLGRSPWQTLFQVALPMARPAIAAGVSLALMETLADFGTVDYFGVSTFTTGIFRTWYGLGELTSAAQLASCLLLFVFALFALERASRGRMRFHQTSSRRRHPLKLAGWRGIACTGVAAAVLFAGFILPCAQLLYWAIGTDPLNSAFFSLVGNSFMLAAIASLCCLGTALFLAYGRRLHPGKVETVAVRTAAMGYAVPGMVIAVGVLMQLTRAVPFIDAAQWGMAGTLMVMRAGQTACLECVYPQAPEFETLFPVVGAISSAIGSLAALETIKIISGAGKPLWGQMFTYDGASARIAKTTLARRADCPCCGGITINDEEASA